jgi:hypothetical protein
LTGSDPVELTIYAARIVTGSVIDLDQTVHGPYGDHVPAAGDASPRGRAPGPR